MDGYERLSSKGYKAVSVFSAFLLLAGSSTQVITLIVLLKKEYRKKILTPCFLSIIVSNFFLLYGSLPTTFVSSLMKGWIFNDKICHLVGFLSGTGSISMIATMAVITVKIYYLVKNKPFAGNLIEPDNSQSKVLLCVWLYSVGVMLPPLTGITEMSIEGAGTNCVPNWSPEKTSGRIYVTFLLTMAYIIPVSVSAIYLIKVRKEINMNINETNYHFVNLCFRNLRNINKMCIFAVVFFTISWLPYAIVVVICMFGRKSSISPEIEMVPTLLAKTSAVFNPFMYAIVNPRFRSSVLQLLRIRLFNCDDNEVEVVSVFVLNGIGTNTKIGNVKEIMKAENSEPENENEMESKGPENKPEEVEAVAKSNPDNYESKGRRSTKNTEIKRSYENLTLEDQRDDDGLGDKTAGEHRKKTLSSEKDLKRDRFSVYQDDVYFTAESGTSSKETNQKRTTRSSMSKRTSHYFNGSCSNFKAERRFSKQPKKHNTKVNDLSQSTSSTLNISMSYRAFRAASSEMNLQNSSIPGSLTKWQ